MFTKKIELKVFNNAIRMIDTSPYLDSYRMEELIKNPEYFIDGIATEIIMLSQLLRNKEREINAIKKENEQTIHDNKERIEDLTRDKNLLEEKLDKEIKRWIKEGMAEERYKWNKEKTFEVRNYEESLTKKDNKISTLNLKIEKLTEENKFLGNLDNKTKELEGEVRRLESQNTISVNKYKSAKEENEELRKQNKKLLSMIENNLGKEAKVNVLGSNCCKNE